MFSRQLSMSVMLGGLSGGLGSIPASATDVLHHLRHLPLSLQDLSVFPLYSEDNAICSPLLTDFGTYTALCYPNS